MEQTIDPNLVKKLRGERLWSQEQVAAISGLSLRTIQRVESTGICSQESRKALAAAFEISPFDLNGKPDLAAHQKLNQRGRLFGFAGALTGLTVAYAGITHSLISNYISFAEAGAYYGSLGAACGVCCAIIGILTKKYPEA